MQTFFSEKILVIFDIFSSSSELLNDPERMENIWPKLEKLAKPYGDLPTKLR